ncbi:MAG: hypothetical protein WCJ62_10265 [Flavobacterium sp.]
MKNKLFILLLLISTCIYAQPGYYGSFEFKVYKEKKLVDLSTEPWKVITNKTPNFNPNQSYNYPDYYKINVRGGDGKENLFVDIVCNKDTMRIYTPSIGFRTVTLDSILFKKGVFKIPTYIYDLQELIKKTPNNYEYIPNLKGNWDLFSTKKEVYKCYIEKVEDLDITSTPLIAANVSNTMQWESNTFLFKKNYIIKNRAGWDNNNHYVNNKYFIYEIKNIDETTFWGGKNLVYDIVSLYAKEKILYALIKKSYPDIYRGETYGIYKLYFVEEEKLNDKLVSTLKKKQIQEDYQAAMKLQGYGGALREKIKSDYNKIPK